jgi:hypothetical protein
MRIWFDTEFIEDGNTIDLLSIGLVREDGHYFYAEPIECNRSRASSWVKVNVIPHLEGGIALMKREHIAEALIRFAGETPEFWAYYASYDWVALCQLYGTMMDLPKGWPMYVRDLRQEFDRLSLDAPPIAEEDQHHALADARWLMRAHMALSP